jgi:hypothetical protein
MKLRAFIVCLVVAGFVAPAFAHAFLQHAMPRAGETLAKAPKEVVLQFTESLEATFSGIEVTDAAGTDVKAGKIVTSANTMRVFLKPLAAGTYRVNWHAVSVDTHRTEGSYRFVVKP